MKGRPYPKEAVQWGGLETKGTGVRSGAMPTAEKMGRGSGQEEACIVGWRKPETHIMEMEKLAEHLLLQMMENHLLNRMRTRLRLKPALRSSDV